MNPMNAYLAQSVMQDRYEFADQHRRAHPERPEPGPTTYQSVTIRRVTPDDRQAVQRIADLEARPAPQGALLIAEVDERILAVRSLDDGATIADPFHPTAELVALLEARSRHLGGSSPRTLTRPFRRAAALVRRTA